MTHPFTFAIASLITIISGLVAASSNLKQYPEGVAMIDYLSKKGLFFLKWRAYANYKKELSFLSYVFFLLFIEMSLIVFFAQDYTKYTYLPLTPPIFAFLWISLNYGANIKNGMEDAFGIVGLFFSIPTILYVLNPVTGSFSDILSRLPASLQHTNPLLILFVLTILFLIAGIFAAIVMIAIFSITPLAFLFAIIITSKICSRLLLVNPKKARFYALLTTVFVPVITMYLTSN